ncbi:glycosyltransferase family 2 protein [Arthrobacter sp. HS15c]|uniref:glycosyltransferase family 2 protein n=1 Tax=Arthrobacter sp. HS15c TaxID=3230279 RepID=UPI0034653443
MQKRVSVIIAARDEEKRIKRCIDSLIASLGPEDEIIVVNDGSTDGTGRELALFGSKIQVLTNEVSMGRAASRNAGIMVAKGKYIAIQDADDEALPGRIEIPVGMLEGDEHLVAASGQCVAVTDGGHYWRHNRYPTSREEVKEQFEASVMAVCHTGSVIRRRALDEAGLYDPTYIRAQDLELFKRLSKLGPIESSPLDTVLYTHNAWLSWAYWTLSRKHHDAIAGRPALSFPLTILRYLLAMTRRSLRLVTTHASAKAALIRARAVNA